MPLPLLPLLATAIPAVAEFVGGMINRGQSRRDIDRQNEYNSPINQVKRLTEAGLPMGAMTGNITGNQSAVPQTSGTQVANAGGKIAHYITTQMSLQQLELLKAQTKKEGAEANKAQAESEYLLSYHGEPVQETNLMRGIRLGQDISDTAVKGARLQNKITQVAADNAETKTTLENTETLARIGKLVTDRQKTFNDIKGVELDNALKEIELRYKPNMAEAEWRKLLADTGLVNENKQGKEIQNDIDALRYQFEKDTYASNIYGKENENLIKGLTYERIGAEFKDYQEYQKFVQLVQDNINKSHSFKDGLRGLVAWAYTATTGITGAAGQTNILSHIK